MKTIKLTGTFIEPKELTSTVDLDIKGSQSQEIGWPDESPKTLRVTHERFAYIYTLTEVRPLLVEGDDEEEANAQAKEQFEGIVR